MNPISATDRDHLQSAQEFLRGNNFEAAAEAVHRIADEGQDNREVLELRFEITAHAQQWEAALKIAELLCQISPEDEYACMCRVCALIELNQIDNAVNTLTAAHKLFPEAPTIPYNLACCACKQKRIADAIEWINKAIDIGGRAEIKLMALDDPDLAPLLNHLCSL